MCQGCQGRNDIPRALMSSPWVADPLCRYAPGAQTLELRSATQERAAGRFTFPTPTASYPCSGAPQHNAFVKISSRLF